MMANSDRLSEAGICMRAVMAVSVVVVASVTMSARSEAQTQLPEVHVSPAPLPPKSIEQPDRKGSGDGKGASDAKGGDSHSLDRLNEQLKRKVDETNPVVNNPPLDARSPDTKTGVVNIPGVQQQYGKNFGHSVFPYRPDRVFTPPIGPRH